MTGEGIARVRTFLRSLTIQGSWNYRTMMGTGVAFALLPILRRIHQGTPEKLEESLTRHSERFNAHPYLSELALGACARMEEEGEDPELIRRFKTALGGSLGGLGDALVWVGWVPACVLLGVVLLTAGVPTWLALGCFLLIYNTGHFTLRIWGFKTGLREGRGVGRRVVEAGLPQWAERIGAMSAALLGVVAGALALDGFGPGSVSLLWTLVAAGGFVTGLFAGRGAWRPTLNATVAVLVGLMVVGALR